MKQIKNAMLALTGGLFLLTVVTSCSKSGGSTPGTPAPVVSSFAPTTAKAGVTVTITGTDFTGATAVSFGATPAASFSVVNATTITAVVAAGTTGEVKVTTPAGSGSKAGFIFDATLPPIDGFNSSSEVAAASLLAHWSFNTNSEETKSGLSGAVGAATGVTPSATYAAGKIGGAVTLTSSYLLYPEIAAFSSAPGAADALANFTISMWTKLPDNTTNLASLIQLNGLGFQDIWGMVGLMTRTNGNVYSLGATTTHVNGTGTHPAYADFFLDPATIPAQGFTAGADGWAFIAITYDGPTNTLSYYGNGALLGTKVLPNVVAPETLAMLTPNKFTFGTFTFKEVINDNRYGAYPPNAADRPWASNGITGSLDDARIFNSALSAANINSLYKLGKEGR